MRETVFEELKRYVGWHEGDEASLRRLHPIAQPHFGAITHDFYERILAHEGARTALQGEAHVGKLKLTLVAWLDTLLTGPWDEAYFERRSRIGRVHVRIALPQHYMFGAMNFVRSALDALAAGVGEVGSELVAATRLAVNKMLDLELAIMLHSYREDMLSQQARTERLATFGQLVGSIGHELRNPLGVIETSLFILKGRLPADEKVTKHVDRIGEQLFISNRIISDLLDMIRDRPLVKQALRLHDIVEAAVDVVKRPDGVRLTWEGLQALPSVDGDQTQLRQVFINLLDNAVHAIGAEGAVQVSGAHVEGHVHVSVEDTGPGIDEATQRRLFEPLITTKDKGIGLGLALVRRIVRRHDGNIVYEPRTEGGARFVVKLPVARA